MCRTTLQPTEPPGQGGAGRVVLEGEMTVRTSQCGVKQIALPAGGGSGLISCRSEEKHCLPRHPQNGTVLEPGKQVWFQSRPGTCGSPLPGGVCLVRQCCCPQTDDFGQQTRAPSPGTAVLLHASGASFGDSLHPLPSYGVITHCLWSPAVHRAGEVTPTCFGNRHPRRFHGLP